MKAISASIALGILLLSLLGFLGCSDGDSGTSTFTGQAIPVAPFGIIDTLDPIYKWTPVPWATKYRLVVQDANQTDVIDEWYTAEKSGCESEEVLCTVHPGIVTTGEHTWEVQACANQECGLWSEPLNYDMRPTLESTDDRFTDNGDGTVSDNYTQLMWSMNPMVCAEKDWYGAVAYSYNLSMAGHDDWRLPGISELSSLDDANHGSPALTPGHPFTNVQWRRLHYWTLSSWPPDYAWSVDLATGGVGVRHKKDVLVAWPVRSALSAYD